MAFVQPNPKKDTLDKVALGLQGFGAGIKGRGAEFNAMMRAENQQLSQERQKAAAEDIRTAKMLYDAGNIAGITNLAQQRVGMIQQLGGDPSDTVAILDLSKAAAQGDQSALTALGTELNAGFMSAVDAGLIQQPAGNRALMELIKDLPPEEQAKAIRIHLGLVPRAVGASLKPETIGGVPYTFDPVSGKYTVAEVEGIKVTPETIGSSEAEIAEAKKRGEGRGTLASKTIEGGFEKLGTIRKGISTMRKAINALDEGASTGVLVNLFPSVKAETIKLEQLANEMGLDVVSSVTFGALSAPELKIAMETALPKGLSPPDLKKWLEDKVAAQEKLYNYYREQIDFIDRGGSVAEWVREKEAAMGSQNPYAGMSDDELLNEIMR